MSSVRLNPNTSACNCNVPYCYHRQNYDEYQAKLAKHSPDVLLMYQVEDAWSRLHHMSEDVLADITSATFDTEDHERIASRMNDRLTQIKALVKTAEKLTKQYMTKARIKKRKEKKCQITKN